MYSSALFIVSLLYSITQVVVKLMHLVWIAVLCNFMMFQCFIRGNRLSHCFIASRVATGPSYFFTQRWSPRLSTVVPIRSRLYSSQTPSTGASEGKKVIRKKVSKVAAMSEQEAEYELEGLNTEIVLHDRRYYEDAAPIITDGAYDKLIRRAESLVGKYPHLGHLVPKLSSVGLLAKSSKLEDFKHTAPMLSLNNCFSKMDLMSFFVKSEASIKGALSAEEDYPPTALDTMTTPAAHVIEYVVEPKIDGLSLSLHYSAHSGALLRAGTRGDGRTGEDVTSTVRRHVRNSVLASLPSHYLHAIMAAVALQVRGDDEKAIAPPQAIIEVRGEIYMSKLDLQEMNRRRVSSNEGVFSTARNAAAGSLRRAPTVTTSSAAAATQHWGDDDDHNDDPSSGGDRGLSFYAYSLSLVLRPDTPPMEVCPTQSDTLSLLQAMGFSVARPWTVCRGADEVHRELTQWELDRPRWAFDADGAVVKVNLYQYHKYLGCNSRAPRWALAFKFAGNSAVTRLRAIEVQVGRTGVLTPVAVLEPVTLDGVLIERASLHNENEVNRLGLGVLMMEHPSTAPRGPDDDCTVEVFVRVKRAGEVIPKIIGLDSVRRSYASRTNSSADHTAGPDADLSCTYCPRYRLPDVCPVCGSPTERMVSGEEEEDAGPAPVTVRCTGGGTTCSAQAVEQISHFCSRDAMNIDGISSTRIKDLFEGGFIRSAADLYSLRERDVSHVSDHPGLSLRDRPRWGDKSVSRLLSSIDRSREGVSPHRFLYSLGVRSVGLEMSRLIMSADFKSFTLLWEYLTCEAEKLRANNSSSSTSTGPDPLGGPIGERLLLIKGVGPTVVSSLLSFASEATNVDLVARLLTHIRWEETETEASVDGGSDGGYDRVELDGRGTSAATEADTDGRIGESLVMGGNAEPGQSLQASLPPTSSLSTSALPLQGRVVVFTGKLKGCSRAQAQELCKSLGGTVSSTMNRAVNLLVDASIVDTGSSTGTAQKQLSSKSQRAAQKGIEVWSEERWLQLVGTM